MTVGIPAVLVLAVDRYHLSQTQADRPTLVLSYSLLSLLSRPVSIGHWVPRGRLPPPPAESLHV